MNVLVGDIGGTKTTLAVVCPEIGPRGLLYENSFPSSQYGCIEEIIQAYLETAVLEVGAVCLAVAGPILAGRAKITNLPWIIDEERLRTRFNLTVTLLNDLEGVAYSVPILEAEDTLTLETGSPQTGGTIAVIAPGTGLGEAFLTKNGEGYRAHASEGSHASFAPINSLQRELLTYLSDLKGFEHVSVERVCSGAFGIPNLYKFLRDTGKHSEPAWLAEKLFQCDDMTPIIVEAAKDLETPCRICIATLELFGSILAAEAGNLALKVLSTGGIYLGGGISPRILTILQKPSFLESFCKKGRFENLLKMMPVKVVLNTKAPLFGAGAYGLQ